MDWKLFESSTESVIDHSKATDIEEILKDFLYIKTDKDIDIANVNLVLNHESHRFELEEYLNDPDCLCFIQETEHLQHGLVDPKLSNDLDELADRISSEFDGFIVWSVLTDSYMRHGFADWCDKLLIVVSHKNVKAFFDMIQSLDSIVSDAMVMCEKEFANDLNIKTHQMDGNEINISISKDVPTHYGAGTDMEWKETFVKENILKIEIGNNPRYRYYDYKTSEIIVPMYLDYNRMKPDRNKTFRFGLYDNYNDIKAKMSKFISKEYLKPIIEDKY